jgi:hypothetical protein
MDTGRYHIVGNRLRRTKPTRRVHENFKVQRLDQSNIAILTDRKNNNQHFPSKTIESTGYAASNFRQFRLFLMLIYSTHMIFFSHDLQQKDVVRVGRSKCYRYSLNNSLSLVRTLIAIKRCFIYGEYCSLHVIYNIYVSLQTITLTDAI